MKRYIFAVALVASVFVSAGSATAVATATAAPRAGGPALVRSAGPGLPTISLNWSGYAVTAAQPFTYVHAEFVQPAVTCTGKPKLVMSEWVGLDGFNDQTVEQDGTDGYCAGPTHMKPVYQAWYEMYPAPSFNVFAVQPGDIVDASVTYAKGAYTLTVADLSSGKSFTKTATCASCRRASAEWIVERPAGCNSTLTKCFLFALADFGTTHMEDDVARVAGSHAAGIGSFTNYPIEMVNNLKKGGFISLDETGPVARATQSFPVTFERSGTPTPITL